ncbi:uncharacterized protein LOC124116410 isoform X2 [Haliotis rufescens]|uniref:uncharacterized protein LOC124116410 isoform X2 n=1 Tax=Haliotis rufescens TaxID=6454 RepID=UPI00201EA9A7|nr:uncharacterized protein LOC124116410 isoform X2 [Haliotis rufescens]
MRQSLFLEALFIIGLLATWEAYALDCPGGVIPPGLTLGVNDVSDGQALFWLNVGRARFGYKPNHYYKLGITTLDTDFPFSEAVLTLQEEDPSRGCGTGHFKFDTPHLYQFKDCQEVLLTNKKTPMTELPPVMWRAPECGCVLVNATVISNGTTYYMDQTPSGFLSKRLCPRQNLHVFRTKYTRSVKTEQPTTTTTTASTTQTPPQKKKLSRPERMDLLCQISLHFNGAELLAREVFLRRRQITRLNLTSLMRTELALDQRKLDIHECCKIVSTTKKTRCFDDMRRRRIDRYCRTGHPDVPFTARRDVFMGEKEERCCWRLGEPRYQCFAHNSIFKTVKGKNSVDYSFDEMDPVNDIGDYPSEIREVEMQHNTDYFIDDATQEVVIRGRETVTYTMSTGPSSSTTMASTTSEARDKGTSKTHTTRKSDQAESSTYSSVLSDVPRRQAIDVKTPVAAISAVDAELDALRKRKRKLDLKLTCCRHGKDAGEVFEVETGLYNHCRHQWKIYRRSLKTGKNMCMNKFMECCVDEAGISSTQAAPTHISYRGHPIAQVAQATPTRLLLSLGTEAGKSTPPGQDPPLREKSKGPNQPTGSTPTTNRKSTSSPKATAIRPSIKSYSTRAPELTVSKNLKRSRGLPRSRKQTPMLRSLEKQKSGSRRNVRKSNADFNSKSRKSMKQRRRHRRKRPHRSHFKK